MNTRESSEDLMVESVTESNQGASPIRIVCIDRRLEDDLMFRQTLVQNISRAMDRPPMILVVGSGESVERALADSGHVAVRARGELVLDTQEKRAVYERHMRELGRLYVTLLTDVGVSSVGFFGADKRILFTGNDGLVVGSSLQTLVALGRSGVVSVLATGCLNTNQDLMDVHPIHVCNSINETLSKNTYNTKGEITVLIDSIPKSLVSYLGSGRSVSWEQISESGLEIPEEIVLLGGQTNHSFFLATVAQVGGANRICVGA